MPGAGAGFLPWSWVVLSQNVGSLRLGAQPAAISTCRLIDTLNALGALL